MDVSTQVTQLSAVVSWAGRSRLCHARQCLLHRLLCSVGTSCSCAANSLLAIHPKGSVTGALWMRCLEHRQLTAIGRHLS